MRERDRGEGLEVFLARRSQRLAFFGGYHAFPGGKVEPGDEHVPLVGDGPCRPERAAALGCAVRELFEETGVLAVAGSPRVDARDRLVELASDSSAELFHRVLGEEGLVVDPGAWREVLRLITPRLSRLRYDTRFFIHRVHAGVEPSVDGPELEEGRWWAPSAAVSAADRGEILIAPPAFVVLRALAAGDLDSALRELAAIPPSFEGSGGSIPWGPGIELLPFHTPPLPPSVPTNTFLVGASRFVVIDPAPGDARGQDHLQAAIARRVEAGHEPLAVVLTHHHRDHVGAVEAVGGRWGLPVWAHARTGELIGRALDRALVDGDRIPLGDGPDGTADWTLRAVFTPGHAQGHLAFLDERFGALIVGDLVSTILSVYVGSPGGDLGEYLDSLRRLLGLPARVLYPSHGPPSLHPEELVAKTIAHRERRVEQVRGLLTEQPRSVVDIADEIYTGLADDLRPLYERATRAALEHLATRGVAELVAEDVYRTAAAE